ncbi:MAG: nucleotidyltransferase [Deltaproteobacteria bacterium]|nr:nucleotidyltransferase [Deltaproteobacteria bacterium]
MTKLHEDWIAFLKLLNAHRVRFLVVGAHAVAAAGRPRFTADLDIWIAPSTANARRVVAAVAAFGFPGLTVERLEHPDVVVFLGREPFRIDLLTSIDGVAFEPAWRHRTRAMLGGVRVGFLARKELIANKRAAGRPKDLADLALLGARAKKR